MSEFDFATRIKRIEAELMALKIAHGSGSQATVYDSEITITQGGVTKGSFTVNQSSDETIELDAGGGGSEPNDGTLTIQKNGTNVATFTANQAGNSTANISVPTAVSQLSDASNYAQVADLATVATTGDYDDLSGKPTIPTVNNGTLTIKKNGTSVGTFSANQSGNSSADITVPTTVAELSDSSDYVKDTDLATVATTGDYDDLTDKPTIGNGTLTITMDGTTVGSFSANTTSDTTIALTSGGSGGAKVYYATCTSSSGTATKVATTTNGDFVEENGAVVVVYFSNRQGAANPTLNVDGTGAHSILVSHSYNVPTGWWGVGAIMAFTYYYGEWISTGGSYANTTTYGRTILSNSVASTSTTTAASSNAVKSAYDLASTKSEVSFTQGLTSGSTVGTITIDGVSTTLYAPSSSGGSTVSYSPTLTSGTIVGALTIDGVASTLYAPTPPTTVAQLSDAANYALVSSLATVATSGSYSDLSNKPTIGNATLTIQKNGTNVQTFTANATSSKTANITVPTTVAELSDASSYAKTADLSTVATSGSYADLSNKPSSNLVFHATCPTATATAAKVATLDDATGFTLADGVMISITFTNSNIDRSATLNVGGTGAKDIIDYTLSNTNTHDGAAIWQSGETVLFSYHSGEDAWERVGGAPTYLSEAGYWDFSVGDVLILSGVASANSSATTNVSVSFRKTFADPPRVFLTNNFNESGSSLWWAYTKSITTTGFTFRSGYTSITGTGGGGNSGSKISWLAIGRIAGAT